MGLIIIGLILSGYFLFSRKILPEITAQSEKNRQANVASATVTTKSVSKNEFIPQEEAQLLKIYYGQKGKDLLTAETRRVRKRSMLIAQARQIVESLLESAENESLYQVIPKGTKLRGLFFDSGVFIVDLSSEFASINNLGAAEQALAVYALVNSLTELDPRAKVRFLINGSEPSADKGHINITQSLTRNEELIAPASES